MQTETYPKAICNLLPGHVVRGKDGDLLQVVGVRRVRRGVYAVQFRNLTTGLMPRAEEYSGAFEVRCVDMVTARCRRCNQPLDHDGHGDPVGDAHYACAVNEREMWGR